MAALAGIKDALSPDGGDCFGIGPKTVGDAEIARLKAWFEATYADELDGRAATPDDFSAWLYRHIAPRVIRYEEGLRDAANSEPAIAELTASA